MDKTAEDFDTKKRELEVNGIEDISNFERLTTEKTRKEQELEAIIAVESSLVTEIEGKEQLRSLFIEKIKNVTLLRKTFVQNKLQDDKVKVSINAFKNKSDFINKLRSVIQRQDTFQNNIDKLASICYAARVEDGLQSVKDIFYDIRNGEEPTEVDGHFINLVKDMSDAQIDELDLLYPEDEVEIKYKPSGSNQFRPLSTASAGQKTTAILTLILSQGKTPLILDQPEDDLDNKLVYELIVDRLKQAKENRQIIVVTHNANIPVNGDAEYVISMNSETNKLKVMQVGTVEFTEIKKEICDVMEGTEKAFEMRSKRYKQIG